MATRKKDRSLFGGAGRYGIEDRSDNRAAAEKDLAAEIEQIEKDMNELRSQYELYYMGIEKLEPTAQRDQVKAKLRRWQDLRTRSTALKFRVQQLKARMVSLENYWERTNRQREAGTYRRDHARVMRREEQRRRTEMEAKVRAAPMTVVPGKVPSEQRDARELSSGVLHGAPSGRITPADRPLQRPPPSAPSMARPSARSAEDLTEPKLRKLYQTYMGARKRCGEAADLRYEDMASALRKQVPRLLHSTGASSVEFKVVIRAGKAVLKAMPKR